MCELLELVGKTVGEAETNNPDTEAIGFIAVFAICPPDDGAELEELVFFMVG
jgi:hypothetical protein